MVIIIFIRLKKTLDFDFMRNLNVRFLVALLSVFLCLSYFKSLYI